MAITFRANKGQALTYGEMDTNLGNFFYSSSVSNNGTVLNLHYTGSSDVPVTNTAHQVSLLRGLNPGADKRIAFYTGSSSITTQEGFIVDPSGSIGINVNETTDLPLTYKLTVSGSVGAIGSFNQISDERLKSDIQPINGALDKVSELRGVTFDMGGKRDIGVIAQEIQKVLPEVVTEDNKGYLSVSYGNIVGVLIEAVKELKAEVEELKNNK